MYVCVCVWGLDGNRRKIKKKTKYWHFGTLERRSKKKKSLEKIQPHLLWFVFVVVVVVTDHLLIYFASVWSGPFFFLSLTSLCLYIFRLLYDSSLCFFSFFSLFHLCVCVCVLQLFFYIRFSRAQFPVSVCLCVCVCCVCINQKSVSVCMCFIVLLTCCYFSILSN